MLCLYDEKCLSITKNIFRIKRNKITQIKFLDIKKIKIKIKIKNLINICIQHEIDHIKGKLLYNKTKYKKKKNIYKKLYEKNFNHMY